MKTVWGQGKSRDMSYTPNTPLDVPTARRCVCGREKTVIETLVRTFSLSQKLMNVKIATV